MICISFRRTAPSFVSLIWPAPPTSIFSVPLGPRFDLRTDASPRPAETLTKSDWDLATISAFGLTSLAAAAMAQ
tara:strand:- start:295 stop:516 length:222 start_codon:yes stop_codon:yes gene_type:complete